MESSGKVNQALLPHFHLLFSEGAGGGRVEREEEAAGVSPLGFGVFLCLSPRPWPCLF